MVPKRPRWPALLAGVVAFAAALGLREQIGAWPFGVLLLIAWGLLAYGLGVLRIERPLRLMLVASLLVLAVVVWNYMAPQPRIQLGGIRVRKLPSTISPGAVELVIHNSGSLPADIVGSAVAQLAPVSRTAAGLAGSGAEAELSKGLAGAAPFPSDGATLIPPGQTTRVEVDTFVATRVVRGKRPGDGAGDRAGSLSRPGLSSREDVLHVHHSAVQQLAIMPVSERLR